MNLEILALIALVMAAIPCGLFLSNFLVYRPLAKRKAKTATPVSVLVSLESFE